MNSKPEDQFTSFENLSNLRKHWIGQGMTGVPDPNCSCSFLNPPKKCIVHSLEDRVDAALKIYNF